MEQQFIMKMIVCFATSYLVISTNIGDVIDKAYEGKSYKLDSQVNRGLLLGSEF
jgi:hypothetical protein